MSTESKLSSSGWLEAAIAWETCGSIHAKYAKGKDALFTTRQNDFKEHATESRKKALEEAATPNGLLTSPIDCRSCGNFRFPMRCRSLLKCNNGDQYKGTVAYQLWDMVGQYG